MKKTGIMHAVPTLDGRVSAQLAEIRCRMERLSLDPDFPFYFRRLTLAGVRPAVYARNVMGGDFLRSDCEWIWMMDADIAFPDDWKNFLEPMRNGADLVAGPCIGTQTEDDGTPTLVVLAGDQTEDGIRFCVPGEMPEWCDVAGTGCLAVHRRVFENPQMQRDGRWFNALNGKSGDDNVDARNGSVSPPLFQDGRSPNGSGLWTEDFEFCLAAKRLGYKLALAKTSLWDQEAKMSLLRLSQFGAKVAHRAMNLEVGDGAV